LNVLLIHPYCLEKRVRDYDVKVVPIGLYYIGAVLKEKGHNVDILNLYDFQNKQEEIKKIFEIKRPNLIGFSVLQANRLGAAEIADLAKKVLPETKVVFGGVAATYLWSHFLKHYPQVDYIVVGEGEHTFLEVVENLENGQTPSGIDGVAWRDSKKPTINKPRPFIEDIDSLPNPAKHFRFQHVVSSRGCPWNCTFCGSPRFWKRNVRFHSPTYFVDQLELLARQGVSHFYVSDDTFTLKKERVIQICKEIIKRKLRISWVAISRVNLVDDEILFWMRKAGCIQISYGVESGSRAIRKIFNKNISDHEIKRAFELTTLYGILPRAYFIYGSPGENSSTIKKSIHLIKQIRPLSSVFYILDLFPGTALYDDFKKRFRVPDDIWLKPIEDIMYFETDPDLDEEKVLQFGAMLRKAFYENLPGFVQKIELIDKEDLYPAHADFLSRLALTFTHGEYAANDQIPKKDKVAKELFKRALKYHPVERAFLGLAIIYQKEGKFEKSIEVLSQGLEHFPDSPDLNSCIALSFINAGDPQTALSHLQKHPDYRNNKELIQVCKTSLSTASK